MTELRHSRSLIPLSRLRAHLMGLFIGIAQIKQGIGAGMREQSHLSILPHGYPLDLRIVVSLFDLGIGNRLDVLRAFYAAIQFRSIQIEPGAVWHVQLDMGVDDLIAVLV